jgi:hypothetical protein
MQDNKYGQLLHPEIRIHRQYFREMCKLIGIYVLYRAPKKDKHYTTYGEIEAHYEEPKLIGCIFDEHPTQQTLKKMGWMSELDSNSSVIHVDYDLEGLQQGALFIIPSGLDHSKGRLFRVVKMTNSIIYPASIACEIVPEYIDNFNQVTDYATDLDDLNILGGEVPGPVLPMDEVELELNLNSYEHINS